jgi:hypothetical protein
MPLKRMGIAEAKPIAFLTSELDGSDQLKHFGCFNLRHLLKGGGLFPRIDLDLLVKTKFSSSTRNRTLVIQSVAVIDFTD